MHVKFIAHGTGSARAAADYLLGERDAAGKPRDGVEVRRGEPDMVAAVADALQFEHKYTSGVIAWTPEDRPTRPAPGRSSPSTAPTSTRRTCGPASRSRPTRAS